MFQRLAVVGFLSVFLLGKLPASYAINLVWDDAGGSASKLWSDNGNWNPDNQPDGNDNLFIGVNSFGFNQFAAANDITLLDQDFTVNSITLGNGADIVNSANGGTTSFEIQVNFHVNVGNGTGTSVITLYDAPGIFLESLDANTMNIANGGQVTLNSINAASPELAILEVDNGLLDVQSGGTLFGNGLVRMADNPGAPTTLLRNDGTITAGFSNGFGGIFGPAATKLQILANNGNARFDWDGGGNGILQVNPNATLDIDVRPGASGSNDDFSGTMNLTTGSTIDIAHAWAVDSATINVNTGAFGLIIIGQDPNPGPAAHIAGANWTMSGGTINIADSWDSLQLDSQLTSTGGTIANSGHLIFNNDATIGSGTDFQMNGASASLTVAAGATVVVNDASFNADGNGNTTNVLTVNSGGRLDINLGAGAEEKLDGVINLNGGRLDLTTASNTWTMDRDLNLANVAGTGASVVGETMHVGNDGGALDANVNVTGAGASFIFAPAVFNSDADVNIAAGATLQTSTVTFESVNGANNARYQGTGKWRFAGTTTVNEATTLDMAGGTVDLDNSDSFFGAARDTFVNAPLTINAATMQSFGDSSLNAFPIPPSITDLNIDNLGADTGILTVNLDNPSDEWTINSIGVMNLTNGNGAQTLLAGSDVNVEGTVNVNGDVRTAARMDITGTVNINTAGQPLHLNGGNSTTDPNTLAGGTINGPGSIASDSRALHGFGTINAPVAFGIGGRLLADNGILNVNGGILSGRFLGTADNDGILNVTDPWNSNAVAHVVLDGGELRGSTVTNDNGGGIRGEGLISARVVNNTSINAVGGNLLLKNQIASSLDGATNNGVLRAQNGNLTVSYPANTLVNFQGTVRADAGEEFFGDRTLMSFQAASNLDLNGGTYRSNRTTTFAGSLDAEAGSDSTINNLDLFRFTNSSNSTINGNLRLVGTTQVESGATFAGGGSLINTAGGKLNLRDGAAVNVLLENDGVLILGNSPGQTTGLDFQQSASGNWNLEIGGLGLNDFDRMNLTGAASLDGSLDLSLIMGFVPTLGNTLNILSATGGVGGTFASVLQPGTMPAGLMFDVNYLGSFVQLEVIGVSLLSGDYNNDGFVGQNDLDLVLLNWGSNSPPAPAGWINEVPNGLIGQAALDGVLLNWGAGVAPLLAAAAVPEPSTLLLAVFAASFGLLMPRYKK